MTRSARKRLPKPDPVTYQAGTWAGVPNYCCPLCPYATVDEDGTALVVTHIASVHRDQVSQAPKAPKEE